ncbi:MAG: alpha/beta fold hydrolase [Xanthomonadales bacterium]|nr:alpha/beta fold hydrolase [Xanthomonadales bacterium]
MMSRINSQTGHVVLVHGLFHRGVAMSVLSRRLRNKGFTSSAYTYPSRRHGLSAQAHILREYIDTQKFSDAKALHFVGHSLGGLVLMTMLEKYARDLPPGRLVLLGSPVSGSASAKALSLKPMGRMLLGSACQSLQSGCGVPIDREIGVIAGTGSMGLGRLLNKLSGPNDGTVTVTETRLDTAADSVQLQVSHFGMLLSPLVAQKCVTFLRLGRFNTTAQSAAES